MQPIIVSQVRIATWGLLGVLHWIKSGVSIEKGKELQYTHQVGEVPRAGVLAEFVVADVDNLLRIPNDIDLQQAAGGSVSTLGRSFICI